MSLINKSKYLNIQTQIPMVYVMRTHSSIFFILLNHWRIICEYKNNFFLRAQSII